MLAVPELIALQFFRMELVIVPTLSMLIAVMPSIVTIKGRDKLKDLATSLALPKSLKQIQAVCFLKNKRIQCFFISVITIDVIK